MNGAPLGKQYVGYMIEQSSKSNKMEKRLSRKSKKREWDAAREKEKEERDEVDEILRIRSSSLATSNHRINYMKFNQMKELSKSFEN